MTRKELRETVSMVAVLAGLVFVGLEIRQSRLAAQAAAYQDLGTSVSEALRQQSMDREFMELMAASRDSTKWAQIDEVGWSQVNLYIVGALRGRETLFRLVQSGALPAEAMGALGYDNAGEQYGDALPRLWPDMRQSMSPDFVAALEERGFPTAQSN